MHRILAFALVVSMAGTPAVFAAGAAQSPANSSMSGAVKSSTGRMIASTTVRLRDLETGQIVLEDEARALQQNEKVQKAYLGIE